VVHVLNGCFIEVFWGFFGVYRKATRSLHFYGSADQDLDLTTMDDTAAFTAEAALDPDAPTLFRVAGEKTNVNTLKAVYEEVTGQELTLVCEGSTDELRSKIQTLRAENPGNEFAYAPYMYQLPMFDGRYE
jgi:hypothetical protein